MFIIGKARSYEIIEYRDKIMDALCHSPELIKLLGCGQEEHPEDVIPYRLVHPYEYIPEACTGTERYINFDLEEASDPSNRTFRNITVRFYILCHEAAARYTDDSRSYLWYDRVVCALEHILCEENILGVGRTILASGEPYCPESKWKGRLLKFTTRDFSNGMKNGK